MARARETNLPFRWDLITPDRLGSMAGDRVDLDQELLEALVDCGAKVLSRSAGGDLGFVGRSLDSIFDLLGGALDGCSQVPRTSRLPLSFARNWSGIGDRTLRRPFTADERAQARAVLTSLDVTPHLLARRDRPVAFVDVVSTGATFRDMFGVIRDWVDDERGQWDVIRTKVRFIGVTCRTRTSPNTFRWQQHAPWTENLPSSSIQNVSMDAAAWSYLANRQIKLTRSFRPEKWLAEAEGPRRSERTRQALAEAIAIVTYGRSVAGRLAMARVIDGEPGLSQPWLRSIHGQLT